MKQPERPSSAPTAAATPPPATTAASKPPATAQDHQDAAAEEQSRQAELKRKQEEELKRKQEEELKRKQAAAMSEAQTLRELVVAGYQHAEDVRKKAEQIERATRDFEGSIITANEVSFADPDRAKLIMRGAAERYGKATQDCGQAIEHIRRANQEADRKRRAERDARLKKEQEEEAERARQADAAKAK